MSTVARHLLVSPPLSPSHSRVKSDTNILPEFNEHQRDVFCVFSGAGVSRLRQFLNTDHDHQNRQASFSDNEGTMYEDGEEPDVILNVTAQANGMAIDENEDEDFGDSEMLGPD